MKMPRKSVTVTFDHIGYEGFTAALWSNMPVGLLSRLADEESLITVLLDAVVEWAFVDFDGNPIALTREGIEQLPSDLLGELVVKLGEVNRHPLARPSGGG